MISVKHEITLKQVDVVPGDNRCPFEVSCSCEWQGLTHSLARAEQFVDSHTYAQLVRGHQVIIKRELLAPAPAASSEKVE